MTREEAKGRFNWMKRVLGNDPTLVAFNERSLEKHIDKIYDDFESLEKILLEKIEKLEEYRWLYEDSCK